MDASRPAAGQASSEYVGLLAIVAVALTAGLAAAGALPAPGFARAVASTFRHGLCLAAGGVCTAQEANAAGLDPCAVWTRSNAEAASATVGIVHVGRDDALAIERRSDGSASVSFVNGGKLGLEGGLGVRFSPLHLSGELKGAAGIGFAAGKLWDFPSWAAARRFIKAYARHETLTGEIRDGLTFWRHSTNARRPPASATYLEGGTWLDLGLDAHAVHDVGVKAELHGANILGRRVAGSRTTVYLRLEPGLAAHLGAVIGALGGKADAQVTAELTLDHGHPAELRFAGIADGAGELNLAGAITDLHGIAAAVAAGHGVAGGGAAEASVALDLTDARNAAAYQGLLDVLTLRASPATLPRRLGTLAQRLDRDGRIDLRTYGTSGSTEAEDASLALGGKLGAGYARTEHVRTLTGAWTRQSGGLLQEREDCVTKSPASRIS